jgi:hypothetical protein
MATEGGRGAVRPSQRLGTWEWTERTGGRLGRIERLGQLSQAIAGQMAGALPPFAGHRGGRAWDRLPELPTPPDSALARSADELVRDLSSPALHGHCLRTWLFAAAFADLERLGHDPELLYIACLLHDLGLTEAHNGRDADASCFAVEGARVAHAFICRQGEEQMARDAANAISLHLNIKVDLSDGAEAVLLHRAARLDAGGLGLGDLPRQTTAEIVARWPRDGFADELAAAIHGQAERRPQSRAALLNRIGLRRLILTNRLDQAKEGA